MATTSLAATTLARGWLKLANACGLPTSSTLARGCAAKKARQAGNVTGKPWSPPMQSTAITVVPDDGGGGGVEDATEGAEVLEVKVKAG